MSTLCTTSRTSSMSIHFTWMWVSWRSLYPSPNFFCLTYLFSFLRECPAPCSIAAIAPQIWRASCRHGALYNFSYLLTSCDIIVVFYAEIKLQVLSHRHSANGNSSLVNSLLCSYVVHDTWALLTCEIHPWSTCAGHYVFDILIDIDCLITVTSKPTCR